MGESSVIMEFMRKVDFRMSPQEYVILSVAVFLVFVLLKVFLLDLIFTAFMPAYRALSKKDKGMFCDRLTSITNSSILVVASIFAWFRAPGFYRDHDLWYFDDFFAIFLCVGLGFWCYHTIFCLIPSFEAYWPLMYIHHATSITSMMIGITSRVYPFHLCMILAYSTEIPNPSIQAMWFLKKFGLRKHWVFTANGVLLFLLWIVGRIYPTYFLGYVLLVEHWGDQMMKTESWFHLVYCLFQYFLFFTMNVWWFYKIARGLLFAIIGKKTQVDKNPDKMQ